MHGKTMEPMQASVWALYVEGNRGDAMGCYMCTRCNRCGKFDEVISLGGRCPQCGNVVQSRESVCAECGAVLPPPPGFAEVKDEKGLGFR